MLNIIEQLKVDILNNKDDLIEGTFCYLLFEESVYDQEMLKSLVNKLEKYKNLVKKDNEIKSISNWIIVSVDQCFFSHHDADDLFLIKNYSYEIELAWDNEWKKRIDEVAKNL